MTKRSIADQNIRYEVITQEDPDTGDLIVPIPPEVLKELGWKEGDEIELDVSNDGQTIYVKKK